MTDLRLAIDEKLLRANIEIDPGHRNLFRAVKVAKFVLLIAIGVFNIFDLFVFLDSNLRTGPINDTEHLPSSVITHQVQFNTAIMFAATTLFAAFGTFLAILGESMELDQLRRGVDAFMWISFAFSQATLFTGVAMVSGISDIFILIGVFAIVFAWMYILTLGNYLNSHAHMSALLQTKEYFMYGYLWVFLIFFLGLNTIIGVTLGFTTVNGGPVVHIIAPIGAFVLYFPFPIILFLHYRRKLFPLAITSATALYATDLVYMLIVPWLAHLAAATDGITYNNN
jgi:hypothetical protein